MVAEMLDDEAPRICQLVWYMLPVENELMHGRYSGMEVFMLRDEYQPAADEKNTQLPLPGQIPYWSDAGMSVIGDNWSITEILFAFGRGVTFRGAERVPSFANCFARIPGDWKYDWVDFTQDCGRIRTQATQAFWIQRVEE